MTRVPFRLGVHVSIYGGIEKSVQRALNLGCSAMQIFSRNPRGWAASPLPRASVLAFRKAAEKSGIKPIVIHTPYLLNLASGDVVLRERSITMLREDLERGELLGVDYVVTHLGSGKEEDRLASRMRVVESLKRVMENSSSVFLLLENSAGGGNTVGSSLEEMAEMMQGAGGHPRTGVCFDTCHGFAAGYDFRSPEKSANLVREIDRTVGLRRLHLFHLNDSSGALGSSVDRHQHIGKGQIGIQGFRSLFSQARFKKIPMILETPKKEPGDDKENLTRIRGIYESLSGKPETGGFSVLGR